MIYDTPTHHQTWLAASYLNMTLQFPNIAIIFHEIWNLRVFGFGFLFSSLLLRGISFNYVFLQTAMASTLRPEHSRWQQSPVFPILVFDIDTKIWLVVWTPLKNISQLGWLFPIHGIIKHVPNHQPAENGMHWRDTTFRSQLRTARSHGPKPVASKGTSNGHCGSMWFGLKVNLLCA